MMEFFPKVSTSEYLAFFGLILTALIGFFSVFYARSTYFYSIGSKRDPIEKYKEMEAYYNNFINIPPSQPINVFLKKAAITSVNDGIDLPLEITDCLIKNYMENYFYLISKLKRTWRYFEVKGGLLKCTCSDVEMVLRALGWGTSYIFFGSALSFFIQNFSWYLDTFGKTDYLNTLLTLVMIITIFFTTTLVSLASFLYMLSVKDILHRIEKMNKEKGL